MSTHDIAALHRQALDNTRRLRRRHRRRDQWSSPTPCEGWTVHELLNHIVAGNLWAAELGNGRTIADVGSALDGDMLGDDPLAPTTDRRERCGSDVRGPGALDRPCAVSYGPVPGSVYAGHRFSTC